MALSPKSSAESANDVQPPFVEPNILDGRRTAVYNPSTAELETKNKRQQHLGYDDTDDPTEKFVVTFMRVNPSKKKIAGKVYGSEWGDPDNPLIGPGGPSLIGKVFRNSISAQVKLQYDGNNAFNFHGVCLWTRSQVEGTIEKLKRDHYLFKPIPLLYRTWMYHENHRSQKHPETADETAQIRQILAHKCIDVDVSGGRWSPLATLLPSSFCCALTCDEITVVAGIFFVWVMQRLGLGYNCPELYKELRFLLLLPRLGWILFLLIRGLFWLPSANPVNVVGLVGALGFCFLDFFFGDKELVNHYKLNCHYEILKALPNRVFVCRRIGAADTETQFGSRGVVHQNVSGIGKWGRDLHLITEIMGCIFELRQFNAKDWSSLVEQYATDEGAQLLFWGLDCYNKTVPTWDTYERKRQVDAATLASKAQSRPGVEPMDPEKMLSQLKETKELLELDQKLSTHIGDSEDPPTTPREMERAPKDGPPAPPKLSPPMLKSS